MAPVVEGRIDVIAPPTDAEGGLFSETNDNLVGILLTYGTARVLLAGDAEAKSEEYIAAARTQARSRSSTFRTAKLTGLKFRALLPEGGAIRLELTGTQEPEVRPDGELAGGPKTDA